MQLPPNIVFYGIMGLAFPSWIIVLGGVGAVTKDCVIAGTFVNCISMLQNKWWAVWFEFFVLLAFAALHVRHHLSTSAPALLAFLALVTAMLMQTASDIMMANVAQPAVAQMELNAAAAGFVMLCALNFAIMVLVGSAEGNKQLGTFGSAIASPRVAPVQVTKTVDNDTPAETPRSNLTDEDGASQV